MLTWPSDWWGSFLKLITSVIATFATIGGVCLSIGKAVDWWLQKAESVVSTTMSSRTGEDKVITKGNLAGAFREATSSQLGDANLLVKSDLDSAVKQLQVTQLVTLCVAMVGAWYISRK